MPNALGPNELRIFPLAQTILFPGTRAPLFIFEARYRAMVRHSREHEQRIAMVTVRPEGVAELAGNPPIFAIGCAGSLVDCQENPDGTFNIVLEGSHRVRVRDELPMRDGRLYRIADVEALEDPLSPGDGAELSPMRGEIHELLLDLLPKDDQQSSQLWLERLFAHSDHALVVNSLCQSLGFSSMEKQGLLETASIRARFDQLAELLRFRALESSAHPTSRSELPH
jgi:Lon protease-like protein